MHDAIIVGTGAAGVSAALELAERGMVPLILDVGYGPEDAADMVREDMYAHRAGHDAYDLLIGSGMEGLSNLITGGSVPVKLTAPVLAYVTKNAEHLAPIESEHFEAVQSFAAGGLANAWGAGLYRFTDEELANYPITQDDLAQYYDKLTREIGISGADDDLAPHFGSTADLLPAVELSHNIGALYRRYRERRGRKRWGAVIGHSRTGVLTDPRPGRRPVAYDNWDFWREHESIYKPKMTLTRLVQSRKVRYQDQILVGSWRETTDGVCVEGRDLRSGTIVEFRCRRLILAAGAINTARIVLASIGRQDETLPILENPALQIPFVMPASIGRRLDTRCFGLVQLNLIYPSDFQGVWLQGSLMDVTAPRRGDFFASLPYAVHDNLALMKYLLPSMIVMQLFYPTKAQSPGVLRLGSDRRLVLRGEPNRIEYKALGGLLRELRQLGAWTHPALMVRVPTGHAIHYAGTLPMKVNPGRMECDRTGRLSGTEGVFVADSSTFPELPAKNMSFTMMANAMRVAAQIAAGLGAAP